MNDKLQITQEELELIEKFISQELSSTDMRNTQRRIDEDKEFASKVKEVKAMVLGIESQGLVDAMDSFHKDMENEQLTSKPTKVIDFKWYKILVAAILIVAIGSYWFVAGNYNERLYNSHFSPDPGLPTTMSTTENYEFEKAMVDYKQGKYSLAITQWETLQLKDKTNDTLSYFIGVSHLANKNENEAIKYLSSIVSNSEFVFNSDAYFYLGLAYLKADDTENATVAFKQSVREEAGIILKELEE